MTEIKDMEMKVNNVCLQAKPIQTNPNKIAKEMQIDVKFEVFGMDP